VSLKSDRPMRISLRQDSNNYVETDIFCTGQGSRPNEYKILQNNSGTSTTSRGAMSKTILSGWDENNRFKLQVTGETISLHVKDGGNYVKLGQLSRAGAHVFQTLRFGIGGSGSDIWIDNVEVRDISSTVVSGNWQALPAEYGTGDFEGRTYDGKWCDIRPYTDWKENVQNDADWFGATARVADGVVRNVTGSEGRFIQDYSKPRVPEVEIVAGSSTLKIREIWREFESDGNGSFEYDQGDLIDTTGDGFPDSPRPYVVTHLPPEENQLVQSFTPEFKFSITDITRGDPFHYGYESYQESGIDSSTIQIYIAKGLLAPSRVKLPENLVLKGLPLP
ncbi:MAG: hypothetical protein QGH40_08070, partial [bacterium]|nr:hypothetical protein [bacterium]